MVLDLIPEKSTVLDIASGTGQLCLELREKKKCRVVGIDLSHRMIDFARSRNPYNDVEFIHGDATDLSGIDRGSFDYATVLFLLHEIPRETQIDVLTEALRIAHKVIIVDSHVPLPKNAHGLALRLVEAIGGREHYRQFADYLAAGGIGGILADRQVIATVEHRSIFWHGCRQAVVLSRSKTDAFVVEGQAAATRGESRRKGRRRSGADLIPSE